MPPLNAKQFHQAVNAIMSGYPGLPPNRLAMMLKSRLGKNLTQLVNTAQALDQVAFDLMTEIEAQGWTAKFLVAAYESRPDNPQLLQLMQDLGLSAASTELESKVRQDLQNLDIARWRTALGRIECQVCRVETPKSMGTGFLVGPDLVLTNYHVMKAVIDTPTLAENVTLRFDYKELANGATVFAGTPIRLAKSWLVDSSPYSQTDLMSDTQGKVPDVGELDYALLRLSEDIGNHPIAPGTAEPGAPNRGWISTSVKVNFVKDAPVFIVQHPEAKPMKLALDTKAIIGTNNNLTRVRYTTNTEPGSSGSPVFNENWVLTALHHSGDRNIVPTYNQGIPIDMIVRRLGDNGVSLPESQA